MFNTKLFVLGLLLGGAILISTSELLVYAQQEEENDQEGGNEVERVMTSSQSDLNITSATSYFEGNYFYIVGEVHNTASNEKEFVRVIATLYNENSITIGTEFTYTTPSTIPSQESSPFKLMIGESDVSSLDAINSYKIVATE